MTARALLKSLLPSPVLQLIRDLRRAEPGARLELLLLAATDDPARHLPGTGEGAIVFICHGNVLRSAVAEALFRLRAPELAHRAASAGLHTRVGRPADPRGQIVARELGVELKDHRSRPLASDLVAGADLLVVMDRVNLAETRSRHPEARNRAIRLGRLTRGPADIPDPYMGSEDDVRAAYHRVAEGVTELIRQLKA